MVMNEFYVENDPEFRNVRAEVIKLKIKQAALEGYLREVVKDLDSRIKALERGFR